MQIEAQPLILFWLITARVAGLLFTLPPFNAVFLPGLLKVAASLLLGLFLVPLAPASVQLPGSLLAFGAGVAAELVFGLAVGFLLRLVFAAMDMAGALLDLELGFNTANLINPLVGFPMPAVSFLLYLLALLAFFLAGGEAATLRLLAATLQEAPPGAWHVTPTWLGLAVDRFGWALATALQLALPVMAASFLVTLALALISRAVPQINAFFLGLPLKQALGLVALSAALPFYLHIFQGLLQSGFADLGGGK